MEKTRFPGIDSRYDNHGSPTGPISDQLPGIRRSSRFSRPKDSAENAKKKAGRRLIL